METKTNIQRFRFLVICLFMLAAIAIFGCGGGGDVNAPFGRPWSPWDETAGQIAAEEEAAAPTPPATPPAPRRGKFEPTLNVTVVGPGYVNIIFFPAPLGGGGPFNIRPDSTFSYKFPAEIYGADLSKYVEEVVMVAFGTGIQDSQVPADTYAATFAGWSGDADCADGRLTLDGDRSCTATFIRSLPGQYPPRADFSITTTTIGTAGQPVQFSAQGSHDVYNASGTRGAGRIVLYEWDFQDDGVVDASGDEQSARNISFTYRDPGLYVIRLRVTDSDGLKHDHAKHLTVQ